MREAHVYGVVCASVGKVRECGGCGEVWLDTLRFFYRIKLGQSYSSHAHSHTLTFSTFPQTHPPHTLTHSHSHNPTLPTLPTLSCTPPPPSHPTQVLATGLSALYSELPTSRDISVEEWQSPLPVIETAVPELRRFTQALTFCNSVLQVRPTFTHLETYLLGPPCDQGSSWDNLSLLHSCLTEPGF